MGAWPGAWEADRLMQQLKAFKIKTIGGPGRNPYVVAVVAIADWAGKK